jgi:hypothetical protein
LLPCLKDAATIRDVTSTVNGRSDPEITATAIFLSRIG